MATPNLRYVTLSDDPSSNYVIFETYKYDIKLNENLFQVLKNILSMNDNESLHMYNEIINILDELPIKLLLQAESYQIQQNYEFKIFDPTKVEGFDKLKLLFEMLFDKIKVYCYQKNIQTIRYYEYNEAFDKLNKICDIIVDSLHSHSIHLVSSFLRIITNNIIEDEKDRLLKEEIEESSKRNENIIAINSYAKETTTAFVYISINNEIIVSIMKSKKKKYLINIKNNTCTCPDFRKRKMKQGLCCKHLMEIRNKSYCMLMIDKVMSSLSQNSCNNSYVPFKHMLNVVYDNSINYNS